MAELARAREQAGLTQRALSAKLKRSHSFAYYIENGHRQLEVCELADWARACGVDPKKLYVRIVED
jgi:transcriptional regulator with XRE-family HTH domain